MIDLPLLGMGCSSLGNLYRPVSGAVTRDTVLAALAAGVGYFDVAPFYGFGLAEQRLGEALRAAATDGSVLISTKVGRSLEPCVAPARERHGFVDAAPFEPHFDYSGEGVLRSHEESLRRLGRDRIDILLAHDLGEATHGEAAGRHLRQFLESGYPALERLRDEGAVSAIGVGVNEVDVCEVLLDRVSLDVILLAGRHTLLEPDSALPLLDRCLSAGVKVIVGGPFNSGILVQGSAAAEARFDYGAPSHRTRDRVSELERICHEHGTPVPAAALQFPLRHPSVSTVLPGLIGRDQVQQAVDWMARDIPPYLWTEARPKTATEPAP